MNDWTSGYVSDIGYTFGYYKELNPLRLRLAFLNAGIAFPEVGTACELGFGQGVSVNVHAAASITSWFGTDFNPAQAAFAQELAGASGADARLYDEAFAQFCGRTDLPDFDYIGLHGIWSWISDENRGVIVDFIRRKLKVGGVLYISYNTQPGWAQMVPLRHLLTEHAEVMAAPGRGILSRIDAAIEFADSVMALEPRCARANPQIADRLKSIKEQNRHYLAHEYFNRDWHPMPFSKMADWLAPAKVDYACSAHYVDQVDILNLSKEQRAFVKDVPDPMFRETVRDFIVNQAFRRDYWVKGARKLSPLDQVEALREQRVVLMTPRANVSLKAVGAVGECQLSEAVYGPLLDYLADCSIRSLAQIETALHANGTTFGQIIQAIMILVAKGDLVPVQDERTIQKVKNQCEKLNKHLIQRARGSTELEYLTSPVTGGAVPVGRFQQLFLLARSSGKKQPEEWVQVAWQILSRLGQRIVKNGATLQTDEENLAELLERAREFHGEQLPILKVLGVAN